MCLETLKEPKNANQPLPRKCQGPEPLCRIGGIVTRRDRGGADIQEQTRRSLEFLDESLEIAGSDKTRILQGQIFLADMSQKRIWMWSGTNGLGRTGTIGRRGRALEPLGAWHPC